MLETISYLGNVISVGEIQTEESKVEAIVDAPDPNNLSQLRSFLGMVTYYQKFY